MTNRAAEEDPYGPVPSMWTGWITFAGVIMMLVGSFHAFQGLLALFRDDYFMVGTDKLAVQVDWTTWGWVHLSLGVLVACAGALLPTGKTWAQSVAVLFAFVSAVVSLAFLPAYPVWSAIMITMCVLVIWAVLVHGHELRTSRH